jgi:hypothetical protein
MMPDNVLEYLLLTQTRGRIMISSEGVNPADECPKFDFKLPVNQPTSIPQDKWDQWINSPDFLKFKQAVTWDNSPDKLWIEYKLPL